jgi:hypothetical protein
MTCAAHICMTAQRDPSIFIVFAILLFGSCTVAFVRSMHRRSFAIVYPIHHTPVLPKPPAPRSETSSESTTSRYGV